MKIVLSIFLFMTLSVNDGLLAQTSDKGIDLYKQGKFSVAIPALKNELQANATDPSLNLMYGICLLKSGGDLYEAQAHLNVAAQKQLPEAFLYLGEIYEHQYHFDLASAQYDLYLKHKRRDPDAAAFIATKKENLEKDRQWVRQTEDIQIIDSTVVSKDKFLSAYNLSKNSGRLETFNKLFDTKEKVDATAYVNEKGNQIIYAQMAENGLFRLYSMDKLLNQYGNEKQLSPDNFGLKGDVNYPFVMPDGVSLYFAAKDEGSMGGYDLFATRYDLEKGSFLRPERLNMPFNSLYNDYMLAIDESKGIGWFASDRFQPTGKVCIYTFIPNDRVQILNIASLDTLAMRARIYSIKDTWRKGKNYSELIALARTKPVAKVENKPDFTFVINDDNVYYHLSDFKSNEAKNLFTQLQSLEKTLDDKDKMLDVSRVSYSKADDDVKRNMTQAILNLEGETESLKKRINDMTLQVRRFEIEKQ